LPISNQQSAANFATFLLYCGYRIEIGSFGLQSWLPDFAFIVMAGLVPWAFSHGLDPWASTPRRSLKEGVDTRDKPAHDDYECYYVSYGRV
jgi:hypothetical protein